MEKKIYAIILGIILVTSSMSGTAQAAAPIGASRAGSDSAAEASNAAEYDTYVNRGYASSSPETASGALNRFGDAESDTDSSTTPATDPNTNPATDTSSDTESGQLVLSVAYNSAKYVSSGNSVDLNGAMTYFGISGTSATYETTATNVTVASGVVTATAAIADSDAATVKAKVKNNETETEYELKVTCALTTDKILTSGEGGTAVITFKDGKSSFEYTASEIVPEITVKYKGPSDTSETTLAETDYSVSCVNNVKPGTATIYVTGLPSATLGVKGYAGTIKTTFTITKAEFKPKALDLTYSTAAQELVSIDPELDGKVQFSLNDETGYTDSVPTATDAGDYKVYYKAKTGVSSNNYAFSTPEVGKNYVTVKIKPLKATLNIYGSVEEKQYTGSELTTSKTYSSLQIVSDLDKSGYKTTDFEYLGNLDGKPVAKGTAVGIYYMGLKDTDFNNLNSNYEVTFKVIQDGSLTIKQMNLVATSSNVTTTYDGLSHKITVAVKDSSGNTVSGAVTEYGLSAGSYSSTHPTCKDVGTYTVYYKVSATGYDPVYGSQTITINQKSVSLTWPSSYSSSVTPTVSGTVSGDSVSAVAYVTSSGSTSVTFSGELTGTNAKNYNISSGKTKSYTVKTTATTTTTSTGSNSSTTSKTTTTGTTNSTTTKTTNTTNTTSGSTANSTTSKSTTGSTGTSSSTGSTGSSGSSSSSSLSSLSSSSDPDDAGVSSSSLGTGLMTMDELNEAADTLANGGNLDTGNDLSSLIAQNSEDESDLYDDEDYDSYYDDYDEDDYYYDDDFYYDYDGIMTYGRMVHLADPDRYPVILAIVIGILGLCVIAGIVFLIMALKKNKSRKKAQTA